MTAFAYVPDLMDRSKVTAAAPSIVIVRQPGELAQAEAGDTVVVDLSRPGVLDVVADLATRGVRIVGFGSHVDKDLLDAAREAGCTEVMARSAFFSDVASRL